MSTQFIEYPKCSTCRKAKVWLQEQGVDFTDRHIAEQAPTAEELKGWWQQSGLPLKKFFNTCGMKYRELNLAARLKEMSEDEMLELLATDGMLVKRPLLVTDSGKVIPGFKADTWSAALGK
jgi:arsenate reductase